MKFEGTFQYMGKSHLSNHRSVSPAQYSECEVKVSAVTTNGCNAISVGSVYFFLKVLAASGKSSAATSKGFSSSGNSQT